MNRAREALQFLREKAKEDGMRHTPQRDAIVEALFSAGGHMTVDELYAVLHKKHPEMGIATVHRTLKLLCRYGLAEEMKIGNSKAKYEAKLGKEHHDHLICVNCGTIIEVHDERIEELQSIMANKEDFKPLYHSLEIFGLCKKCS